VQPFPFYGLALRDYFQAVFEIISSVPVLFSISRWHLHDSIGPFYHLKEELLQWLGFIGVRHSAQPELKFEGGKADQPGPLLTVFSLRGNHPRYVHGLAAFPIIPTPIGVSVSMGRDTVLPIPYQSTRSLGKKNDPRQELGYTGTTLPNLLLTAWYLDCCSTENTAQPISRCNCSPLLAIAVKSQLDI